LTEHRIYIEKDGVPISPFHDIPLYAKYVINSVEIRWRPNGYGMDSEQKTLLNMVVEIPRWTNGKLEVRDIFIWVVSRRANLTRWRDENRFPRRSS